MDELNRANEGQSHELELLGARIPELLAELDEPEVYFTELTQTVRKRLKPPSSFSQKNAGLLEMHAHSELHTRHAIIVYCVAKNGDPRVLKYLPGLKEFSDNLCDKNKKNLTQDTLDRYENAGIRHIREASYLEVMARDNPHFAQLKATHLSRAQHGHDDRPYLDWIMHMEFVHPGFTVEEFAQYMNKYGQWKNADRVLFAASVTYQMADGLRETLGKSMRKGKGYHPYRDLKLGNVLMRSQRNGATPRRFIKIIDANGVAPRLGDIPEVYRSFFITPSICAPELIKIPGSPAGDISHASLKSDVYALGCNLYYLLTGRYPFARDNPHATLQAQRHDELDLDLLRQTAPPDLIALITACLEKTTAYRTTLSEIMKDLGQLLHGTALDPTRDFNTQEDLDLFDEANDQMEDVVEECRTRFSEALPYFLQNVSNGLD